MTIIYKIVCKDKNIRDFYIGSTIDFNRRKSVHKYYCKSRFNLKLYNFINDKGGWDNFEMEIVQKYANIQNRNELNQIEYKFILDMQPSLNITNPGQYKNKADYKLKYQRKNKEKTRQWSKTYYDKNRELVKEKALKKYYNKKNNKKKSTINIDDSNQKE